MIIVLANLKCKPGVRDKVVDAASSCIRATRKEEGCISYELMASTEDDCALMFVERWADKAALERHLNTPHLAKFREERAPYLEGSSEVHSYEVI